VTIRSAAPANFTVNISSGNPDKVIVPSTVTVPQGATTVNFVITTKRVQANTTVQVKATKGTTIRTANVTLTP
jgi:hypothetical protein